MRWRAVLYVKDNKKDLYSIEAMVSTTDRMQAISMISQYAYTMTDDKTKDIKIIEKRTFVLCESDVFGHQ